MMRRLWDAVTPLNNKTAIDFTNFSPKDVVVPGYNMRKNHMLVFGMAKNCLMDKTSVKYPSAMLQTFVNHFGFSSPEFVHKQFVRTLQYTQTLRSHGVRQSFKSDMKMTSPVGLLPKRRVGLGVFQRCI